MPRKTRVLVVDDSALMRQILTEVLSTDPTIEVVGTASDPIIAQAKIKRLNPDVLTLDVEMPRMDGLSFLDELMRSHPLPVLMISSLTDKDCEITVRALELGAVDYVRKPQIDVQSGTLNRADEIIEKVKMAAAAHVGQRLPAPSARSAEPRRASSGPPPSHFRMTNRVIAVGASTGGTEALVQFLSALPADSPGVVIVQHMPAGFTRAFARRLDSLCRVRVKEACDGDRVLDGHVLLAPGDYHMEIRRNGATSSARIFRGEPVNRHRPSVDVLFRSCATALGPNAVGVILTGMGADGARGLLEMRQAGAHTIAQDEASCVVFGMPREAIALGAAEEVNALDRIAVAALRMACAN